MFVDIDLIVLLNTKHLHHHLQQTIQKVRWWEVEMQIAICLRTALLEICPKPHSHPCPSVPTGNRIGDDTLHALECTRDQREQCSQNGEDPVGACSHLFGRFIRGRELRPGRSCTTVDVTLWIFQLNHLTLSSSAESREKVKSLLLKSRLVEWDSQNRRRSRESMGQHYPYTGVSVRCATNSWERMLLISLLSDLNMNEYW